MADTAAERVRRSRAHKKGDHTLCLQGRCPDAAGGTSAHVAAAPSANPGGIEQMAAAFVESLPYPEDDPRWILGQLAIELAKRVDDDGAVPATVRELRTLLVQLAEIPNQSAGQVDELRLQRARRRLDGLLAAAAV